MHLARTTLVAAALAALPVAHAYTFTDDFSGPSINTTMWTPEVVVTSDSTITLANGRIEMAQSDWFGGSALAFNWPVNGDFDFQVDFTLLDWPAANYERIAISGSVFGAVERSQHPGWFNDAYVAHFSVVGDGVNPVSTADSSGTLRVTREGSTISGYFKSGQGWTLIHSLTSPSFANDTMLSLTSWNGYASVPTRIAFDNVRLHAPAMSDPVPEPATWALVLSALLPAGWLARRKRLR